MDRLYSDSMLFATLQPAARPVPAKRPEPELEIAVAPVDGERLARRGREAELSGDDVPRVLEKLIGMRTAVERLKREMLVSDLRATPGRVDLDRFTTAYMPQLTDLGGRLESFSSAMGAVDPAIGVSRASSAEEFQSIFESFCQTYVGRRTDAQAAQPAAIASGGEDSAYHEVFQCCIEIIDRLAPRAAGPLSEGPWD
ncbi:hypothetical protein [Ramlibacter sp.]|uniref:hypothetical protein n=1 Tax=Ramlibacter sp. TaxID=1917967 RepID=UPI003D0B6475